MATSNKGNAVPTLEELRKAVKDAEADEVRKWSAHRSAAQASGIARQNLAKAERAQNGALAIHTVRAILRKAGCVGGTSNTTSIRGWSDTSSGFRVSQRDAMTVWVSYTPGSNFRSEKPGTNEAKIGKYRTALTAAGLKVTDDGNGRGLALLVTR